MAPVAPKWVKDRGSQRHWPLPSAGEPDPGNQVPGRGPTKKGGAVLGGETSPFRWGKCGKMMENRGNISKNGGKMMGNVVNMWENMVNTWKNTWKNDGKMLST